MLKWKSHRNWQVTLERNKSRGRVAHCRTASVRAQPSPPGWLREASTLRNHFIGSHPPTSTHTPRPSSASVPRADAAWLCSLPFPPPNAELRLVGFTEPPLRPHQCGSCPGAPPSCGRCAAAQLANPAACGDGCRSGECGPPVGAARGQGRGALASAARCGAAAGLPAARLGRRGRGPEAAGGSLHFPARPGVPGVRWARGCPGRSAATHACNPSPALGSLVPPLGPTAVVSSWLTFCDSLALGRRPSAPSTRVGAWKGRRGKGCRRGFTPFLRSPSLLSLPWP